MVLSLSLTYHKWCQIQLSDFIAVQIFRGILVRTQISWSLCSKPASPSGRYLSKVPHVKKTTSLLHNSPTLSVPQAIRAEKITQAESNNPGMQMWIRCCMQSNTSTTSTTTPTSIDISSHETILSYLSQSTTSTIPTKLPPILKQQQNNYRAI